MRLLPLLLLVFISLSYSSSSTPSPTPSAAELKSLGEAALAKGDPSGAINYYSQLIKLDPSQMNYFLRSTAYLKKRAYNNAVADLSKAVAADPKFTKGLMYRAKVLKIQGKCEAAAKDVESVLAQSVSHKDALAELPKVQQCAALMREANRSFEGGRFEESKYFLTQALEIAYDSQIILTMRARCHMALKDFQSALVDTRKILQTDKTAIDALLLRGQAYYQLGEHDNAQTHFKEALRQDPEDKSVIAAAKQLKAYLKHFTEGEAKLAKGQFQQALTHFQAAIDADPAHTVSLPWLNVKKAEALIGLKRGKDAVAACNEAIGIDENMIDAWIKRGEARLLTGDHQDAVNDYTKAHQMDQNNMAAREGLQNAQRALKLSLQKDYYKELGVARDATDRQIKKAYHKAALQYHPDKLKEGEDKELAEKKFRDIAEAYEILSDPETRAKYDRGEEIKPGQGPPGGQGGGGFNPFGGGFPGGFPFGGGQQFHQQGGGFHFHYQH